MQSERMQKYQVRMQKYKTLAVLTVYKENNVHDKISNFWCCNYVFQSYDILFHELSFDRLHQKQGNFASIFSGHINQF